MLVSYPTLSLRTLRRLLITVGPLVSNMLEDVLIEVELRDGDELTISDLPQRTKLVPISLFIADEFRLLESSRLRSTHISWEKFGKFIEKTFQLTLTQQDCELGYKYQPRLKGLPVEYFVISTATAFTNAIGVLFNASRLDRVPGRLPLCLWSPVPNPPISLHHCRIPDIALTRVINTSSVSQRQEGETAIAAQEEELHEAIASANANPASTVQDGELPAIAAQEEELHETRVSANADPASTVQEGDLPAISVPEVLEILSTASTPQEEELFEPTVTEDTRYVSTAQEDETLADSVQTQLSPTDDRFAGNEVNVGKLIELGDRDDGWETPERDDDESDDAFERRMEEYVDHIRELERHKYIPSHTPQAA
jgi:hypothetical protein